MIVAERRSYILKVLNETSFVDMREIAETLNISLSTVRRDLEALEKKGLLRRVLGGAEQVNRGESSIMTDVRIHQQYYGTNMQQKNQIAQLAAEVVSPGDSVFLDGGTSVAPLFRYLIKKHIQIVTNNFLALRDFSESEANIIIVGGHYLPHFYMSSGFMMESFLSNFYFDHAFISCSGVSLKEGLCFISETETMALKRTALSHSAKKHLLIDSSKLNFHAFCRFEKLDYFDNVFCDAGLAHEGVNYPPNFVIANEKK